MRALVALALLAAAPAAAATDAGPAIVDAPFTLGAPEATAQASPSEVRLGQPFTLFVTAVYGGDVRVNLPEPLVLGPAFEVRRSSAEDRRRSDGRRIREWQLELVAWELGELAIPPIPVTFTSGGRASAASTDPVPMRVVAVLGDADGTRALRPLSGPVDVMRRDWTLAFAAGGVVGLAAAVLALRRRRSARPAIRARRRSLGVVGADALGELDAIEASGLLDRDQKAAFVAMAEVVRGFLGRRYGFAVRDQTTDDLRRRLGSADLAPEALGLAMHWIDDADRVKFANHHAGADEARAQLAAARALVTSLAEPVHA